MSESKLGMAVVRYLVWGALFIAGLALIVAQLIGPDSARAWRALLIGFLYFTPMAAGLITWTAIVRISHGSWAGPLENLGAAGISFAVPSVAALAALWIGGQVWIPRGWTEQFSANWLSAGFVFLRDLFALILFWILAAWYLFRQRRGRDGVSAGILIFAYCAVFTLLGFDLVMALKPRWASTLLGGYYFISGLYIAILAWTFRAVWRPEAGTDRKADLGKLILAFAMLTTYLMFTQLLVIWYENLPRETQFMVPRMNFPPWSTVSLILLAAIYLGPVAMLISSRAKRSGPFLGALSLVLLAAMWLERVWLVSPSFYSSLTLGWPEFSALALYLGIFALGIEMYKRLSPFVLGAAEAD